MTIKISELTGKREFWSHEIHFVVSEPLEALCAGRKWVRELYGAGIGMIERYRRESEG